MFLVKWLKKVFRMTDKVDNTNTIESNNSTLPNGTPLTASLIDERKKNVKLRKFEIQVFNEDLKDDGTVELKPEKFDRPIVLEVATPDELKMALQQYRMCGQIAKIIREIDPPPPTQELMPQPQHQPVGFSNIPQRTDTPQMAAPLNMQKPKPKIVTIGDMQVKYDGDKVYQRQWVKLNASEAANFRVVNDSSNKIVSLTGKHIEAKRWVLVEETPDDNINDAVETILAGN